MIWDSLDSFATSVPVQLDNVLPDKFTRISHEVRTKIQSIPSGCRQCALHFSSDMAELDLHSDQISRLVSNPARDFESTKLIRDRDILVIERTEGDERHVALKTLSLSTSKTNLDKALEKRRDSDIDDWKKKRIDADELADRIIERERLKEQTDKTRRGKRGTNLALDKRRAVDLRDALKMLNSDKADALLRESKFLFRNVVERAAEAGRAQAEKIAPFESELRNVAGRDRWEPERIVEPASSSSSGGAVEARVESSTTSAFIDGSPRAFVTATDIEQRRRRPEGEDETAGFADVKTGSEDEEVAGYAKLTIRPENDGTVAAAEPIEDIRRFDEIRQDPEHMARPDF